MPPDKCYKSDAPARRPTGRGAVPLGHAGGQKHFTVTMSVVATLTVPVLAKSHHCAQAYHSWEAVSFVAVHVKVAVLFFELMIVQ